MDRRLPTQLAYRILAGFDKHYRLFTRTTVAARDRFAQGDWSAVQEAQKERIRFYSERVNETTRELIQMLDKPVISTELWRNTKQAFSRLVLGHPQAELCETFFNSVFSRLFRHRGLDNQHLYIHAGNTVRAPFRPERLSHSADLAPDPIEAIRTLLQPKRFGRPFADLDGDLALLWQRLEPLIAEQQINRIELLDSIFYRNKGAYLVGRLLGPNGFVPLILPIRHSDQGLQIDAVLTNEDDLSIVFSFTRAYFMVATQTPGALVRYLKELLPHKTWAELYSAIGLQKHGKTEFYRAFLHHLNQSRDQFVAAPGIKGMVMTVFTLPSLDIVFKVIKDEFTPPKDSNKAQVKGKYALVKQHDRVGRMADTHAYSNFVFPRQRFSDALIEELLKDAPAEVELTDNQVIIKHLYVERRMTPLNLYLDDADEAQLSAAIDDYGKAIKQLAAANIFPGDMLFKNFGVTRHGRVVFYDYDEISYMTECNFRDIPAPRYPEDEWAAEPWYSVGPMDVFPEEFGRFLLSKAAVRKAFMAHHADLLTRKYWQGLKDAIEAGQFPDLIPYPQACRLRP
ncbi:bifunctional isocitrate dehydrogenase kinase/phosphatase [Ferrimonas balearica]|uniref:bifunctional isocitrate dehydrogenase kinase/phosphatase n=1 Tax=Ferrimonas balearica TaxID=44012 RepID=UPI001C58C733|nr:bifunctional isocitrate dehydrogenase kinase/phosphatase [Ferrimonas balearica]MBW3140778.1 bifunctional isocitrate dehydrogenase kinase/phosphatase [Ferrimonas balearica]MBW3165245.1 bifunctional isocitrate dehydrogenase kinase/phosphatase [Ferrimonas balearica]MBY6107418.1 bifunctional isocitrate dehydrogenase kinase/phosphatase [Ferrimonas balearica]